MSHDYRFTAEMAGIGFARGSWGQDLDQHEPTADLISSQIVLLMRRQIDTL